MFHLFLQCAYKLLAEVPPGTNASLVMDGKYGWSFRLRNDNASLTVPDRPDGYVREHSFRRPS